MTLENNVYEVGLQRLVDENKPTDYIGREALRRIREEGVRRKLAGIEIEGERIEFNTTRWPVTVGGETAGAVTSAIWSPRLKKNIGYAMLPVAHTAPGTALRVAIPGAGERQAILTANDPKYPYGELPAGGEPRELTPFPELSLGRDCTEPGDESLLQTAEWRYVAEIDPELARRAAAFVDHCLVAGGVQEPLLGPGVRELIAIAALCARGEVEFAAQHIRRAYAYGMNRHQVLEAISCVLPMTGALTVQVGARAMMQAERS